jgi:hypothetical protein
VFFGRSVCRRGLCERAPSSKPFSDSEKPRDSFCDPGPRWVAGTCQNAPVDSVESRMGQRPACGTVSASASYWDIPGRAWACRPLKGWRRLDAYLPTLHIVPPFSMAAGTIIWAWTAFPPRASVGHKLYTVAWSQILRPTSKCGPFGFRWPRHGPNWLKRWSGYSRIKRAEWCGW